MNILLKTLSLFPGLSFIRINEDHGYLTGNSLSIAVKSPVSLSVLELLENPTTSDEIVASLKSKHAAEEIYYAIYTLFNCKYISNIEDPLVPLYDQYALGIINEYTCSIHTSDSIESTAIFDAILNQIGFSTVPSQGKKHIDLVICNNYCSRKTINTFDKLSSENSVIFPIAFRTIENWAGPLLFGDKGPCPHCLTDAITRNRPVENLIANTKREITPVQYLYSSSLCTLQWFYESLQQLIRDLLNSNYKPYLTTNNHFTANRGTHWVRIVPQCTVCGDFQLFKINSTVPVRISSVKAPMNTSGGYRTISPQQTFDKVSHLISPITGIISHLDKVQSKNDDLRQVWSATYFVNPSMQKLSSEETFTRNSYGKGSNEHQAKVSALCEAIERYASIYTGQEMVIEGPYSFFDNCAIDPDQLMNFSSSQYANRNNFITGSRDPENIPIPFDKNCSLLWTPAWSLSKDCARLIPLTFCYSMTPVKDEFDMCPFSSNGNASGNCKEEAIVQGFFELVERDAVAIWWYNQISLPEYDIDKSDDPYISAVKNQYENLGWKLWVLNATHDFEIPVAVALAENKNGDFAIGLGCHINSSIAITRAITEIHQTFDPAGNHPPVWNKSQFEHYDFLYPSGETPGLCEMYDHMQMLDSLIAYCIVVTEAAGMEMIVLDYSRPDIPLATVKVIIPGMRHFWRRLGDGRLYDVPVKMGWLSKKKSEDEMNPFSLLL
jgi:ribosomal protein S12 methylthiotransferase accessory factor